MTITTLDIVQIVIICLVTLFLLILASLDKFITKPARYIKLILIIIILIITIEETISLSQNEYVKLLFPIIFFLYFLIYPLSYLYFKETLSNHKSHDTKITLFMYFIFPLLIFIIISIIYLPLSYEEKKLFLSQHVSLSHTKIKEYFVFQSYVIPAYYVQFLVYLILFFKLVFDAKREMNGDSFYKLKLIRLIYIFIIGVIIYEIIMIIAVLYITNDVHERKLIEMILSLIFIFFAFYVVFNQTLINLQLNFTKLEIRINKVQNQVLKLNNNEKNEIKESIQKYLAESKIYLNPNLNIETFSKKIHIPARKISVVINELLNKNFHQIINEYRISEAIKMLETEIETIENIYLKVGFNSRSTFNRVFKEITNLTPSEYINKNKTD